MNVSSFEFLKYINSGEECEDQMRNDTVISYIEKTISMEKLQNVYKRLSTIATYEPVLNSL
jgi:hypothetical protein